MERWSSRIGVVLAVAGSAVGLGNFLRFPGQAVQHGGGAFMIPYFTALILLGIPIGWAEWTMGRYGGQKGLHSAPAILGAIGGPVARYFGVFGLLIPLVVYMYYVLIEAWCLNYAWAYATGSIGDPAVFFQRISGITGHGTFFRQDGAVQTLTFVVLVVAINTWLVYRGLSRGVEWLCRWAMPTMAIFAVIVLVRVLTLGTPDPVHHPERSVEAGLGFMWNPQFSRLSHAETWLAAASQVFFSLSVGFGVIINYASYLRRRDDIVLSSLTASATNELFEVAFGGMITITAAFVFLGASGTTGGTFGLGFQTLPVVFNYMGGVGRFVGAVWFAMLFLAAITSSLSMLQPVKAFLVEALGMTAGRAVLTLVLVAAPGSAFVLYYSGDLLALDTLDFWVGTVAIFILATVQLLCFSFVLGTDRGLALAHEGANIRIPGVFRIVLRWIAPTYLFIVFVGFCIQSLPERLAQLAHDDVARGAVALALLVFLALVLAVRYGRRQL